MSLSVDNSLWTRLQICRKIEPRMNGIIKRNVPKKILY